MCYWKLPSGKARTEARAEWERNHPLDTCAPKGTRDIQEVSSAFISRRGYRWPFVTATERKVARMGAESNLIPNKRIRIEERDGKVFFVGSKVCVEAILDGVWGFRATYRAAVDLLEEDA